MWNKIISLTLFFVFAAESRATIYLDHEVDPVPVIEIMAVIPAGFAFADSKTPGAMNMLPFVFESGTLKYSRQQFNDAMAEFAASSEFRVGRQYSYVELSFPYIKGKDYSKLVSLVAEAFERPRFTEETFQLSKKKFLAALQGSLDSDASMAASAIRRWHHKHHLGGRPVFVEDIKARKLSDLKNAYQSNIRQAQNVWVGVLSPEEAMPLVEKITKAVFKNQGKIKEGKHLKQLVTKGSAFKPAKAKKQILLIDKADRKQVIFAALGLAGEPLKSKEELSFLVASYALVENGFGAVFQDVIRRQKGFSYYVSSMGNSYLGRPTIGFLTNPQGNRALDAITTISELIKGAYASDKIFKAYPEKNWEDNMRSFRYGKILSSNTSEKRIGERMQVVTGGMSKKFYKSSPSSWKRKPSEVAKVYNRIWNKSSHVFALVGSAKDLAPMLRIHFPDYSIKTIPYKESISIKSY